MSYWISRHAQERMAYWSVSLAEVEATISEPDVVRAQGGERNRYEAHVEGRLIFVVMEFSVEPPVVVTVYPLEER